MFVFFFFFKQKTAYEMRISDWSSDVCSSDLLERRLEYPAKGVGTIESGRLRQADHGRRVDARHLGEAAHREKRHLVRIFQHETGQLLRLGAQSLIAGQKRLAQRGGKDRKSVV